MISNYSMNDIPNVYYRATTQPGTWYMGLVDNAAFTAFAAADTMSSHTGWAESVAYAAGTRPIWAPDAAASGSISNSTAVSFAINATATIHGLFITSDSTKSGTSGNLSATAAFSGGNQVVANGDTLKATFTIAGTTS